MVKGGGKCKECRAEAEAARGTAAERGYDAAWRAKAARHLRGHPYCSTPGCTRLATDVDHDPPRRELVEMGVPDPDAEQYLNSKCHQCHSRKTALQDGGFGIIPRE